MTNPNTAPSYPRKQNGLLFYCGASSSDADCQAQVSGDGTWKTVRSVGGNYDSIVLSGGQSSTITFNTPIKPNSGGFCLALNFRKGPLDASRGDESSLKLNFKMDYARAPPMELNAQTTSFMGYNINLGWGMKTKIGFTFSVPRGAGRHVVDIRKIEAYDGPCS
ncbi:CRISP/Allergen/PR-1 [Araneus ventricosus]|uniref:CRISP/Allergen/PR-1 n=1 Tax=Araneus ventricosus TaxID=182803 RepID=A0A4Y2X008_ARAVE|nr:CRISP/Allergen/PR-1 [Araneus ventricosus]